MSIEVAVVQRPKKWNSVILAKLKADGITARIKDLSGEMSEVLRARDDTCNGKVIVWTKTMRARVDPSKIILTRDAGPAAAGPSAAGPSAAGPSTAGPSGRVRKHLGTRAPRRDAKPGILNPATGNTMWEVEKILEVRKVGRVWEARVVWAVEGGASWVLFEDLTPDLRMEAEGMREN